MAKPKLKIAETKTGNPIAEAIAPVQAVVNDMRRERVEVVGLLNAAHEMMNKKLSALAMFFLN